MDFQEKDQLTHAQYQTGTVSWYKLDINIFKKWKIAKKNYNLSR